MTAPDATATFELFPGKYEVLVFGSLTGTVALAKASFLEEAEELVLATLDAGAGGRRRRRRARARRRPCLE